MRSSIADSAAKKVKIVAETEVNVVAPVRGNDGSLVGCAAGSTRRGGGASEIPLPPLAVTQTCSFDNREKDRIRKKMSANVCRLIWNT